MARKLPNGSVEIPEDPKKRETWLNRQVNRILEAHRNKKDCPGVGVGYEVIGSDLTPDHSPVTARSDEIREALTDHLRSFFKIPPPARLLPGHSNVVAA